MQRITGATLAAIAGLAAAESCTAQLLNPGFEIMGPNPSIPFANWVPIGFNLIDNISQEMDPAKVRTGSDSCKIFGQFNGFANDTLVYQDVPITAGQFATGSIYALHHPDDQIQGFSAAFMAVEVFNASNVRLEFTPLLVYSSSSPTGTTFEPFDITVPMPANAAKARLVLGYHQETFSEAGAIFFDDAALGNSGPIPADYFFNPSFETVSEVAGVPISGWTMPGGNAFPNTDAPRTGDRTMLMYGQFSGLPNTTVAFQDMSVQPGDLVDASVYALHLGGDSLAMNSVGVSNEAFVNIEFRDPSDNLLTVTNALVLNSDSPTDTHILGEVSATAPGGADSARIVVGFFQPDEPMMGGVQPTGAAHFDDASLVNNGPNTGIVNPSFETYVPNMDFEPSADFPLPGWSNAGLTTAGNIAHNDVMPRSGRFRALMFGQFPGGGQPNDTVIFQDFAASPGSQVEFSVWALHLSSDPIQANNFAFANIEWRNASNQLIDFDSVVVLTAGSATDTDIQSMVSGTAPAGTATARVVLGYHQEGEASGAVHFDDAEITITAPACPGDANGDNMVDISDLNIVLGNFGTSGPNGDLNSSGTVDIQDLNLVLGNFGVNCN